MPPGTGAFASAPLGNSGRIDAEQENGREDVAAASLARRIGEPRLEHPAQVAEQAGGLAIIEPHTGDSVTHTVSERVDVIALQIAVGVGQEASCLGSVIGGAAYLGFGRTRGAG